MKIIKIIVCSIILALPLTSFAGKEKEFYPRSGTVQLNNFILSGSDVYYHRYVPDDIQPFIFGPWLVDAIRIYAKRLSTEFRYEIDLKKTNYVEFTTVNPADPGPAKTCRIQFSDITSTTAHYELYDNMPDGCGIGNNWIAINFHSNNMPKA